MVLFDVISFSFFFFKQKTAYEMRISDWSSDVCSSDLLGAVVRIDARSLDPAQRVEMLAQLGRARGDQGIMRHLRACPAAILPPALCRHRLRSRYAAARSAIRFSRHLSGRKTTQSTSGSVARGGRSEEHTSELQSLMRISYAVFCLKK